MTPRLQEITALHAEYQRLTGLTITLLGREAVWWEWLKRGLTLADLRLLVADKRRRIAKGELPQQSLAFRNLAGNVDYAEEDILMLRAKSRTPRVDPARAEALRAVGKDPAPAPPDARRASEVVAKLTSDPAAAARALEELRRLRNSLQ